MTKLVIDRTTLPSNALEWLEAVEKKNRILLFSEEKGQIALGHLENVDPAMIARIYANTERYHMALERLADS